MIYFPYMEILFSTIQRILNWTPTGTCIVVSKFISRWKDVRKLICWVKLNSGCSMDARLELKNCWNLYFRLLEDLFSIVGMLFGSWCVVLNALAYSLFISMGTCTPELVHLFNVWVYLMADRVRWMACKRDGSHLGESVRTRRLGPSTLHYIYLSVTIVQFYLDHILRYDKRRHNTCASRTQVRRKHMSEHELCCVGSSWAVDRTRSRKTRAWPNPLFTVADPSFQYEPE